MKPLQFLLPILVVAAFGAAWAQGRRSLPPVSPDSGFAWIDGADDVPHVVEREMVKKGVPRKGHPRDLIAPIDEPRWYASHAEAADEIGLADDDRVLGVVIDGDARAYPTRILDRHEVVNDTIGDLHFAVVW